MWHL
jgi:hypothetical protein